MKKSEGMVLLLGYLLSGTVYADTFNCTLPHEKNITLVLTLPSVSHQTAGKAQVSTAKTTGNLISYTLPLGLYQLNLMNLAYTFTPKGKVAEQGKCQRLQAAPSTTNHCPTHRPYCKNIKTCSDAKYLLNQCGFADLDSDGDGTPCEALCGKGAK